MDTPTRPLSRVDPEARDPADAFGDHLEHDAETPEADALDQQRPVPLDDDDRR